MALNCLPIYTYTPTFVADGSRDCISDLHEEERARTPVRLGGTFFRTKNGGDNQNLLSIEMVQVVNDFTLTVRDGATTVETFAIINQGVPVGSPDVCTPNLITAFRSDVNANSNYIEMPTLDYGGAALSAGTDPIWQSNGAGSAPGDAGCLTPFPQTSFTGGAGGPSGGPTIVGNPPETTPRTGPSRTTIIITLSEIILNTAADLGQKTDPPVTEKVRQWDGTAWIDYSPNADCR